MTEPKEVKTLDSAVLWRVVSGCMTVLGAVLLILYNSLVGEIETINRAFQSHMQEPYHAGMVLYVNERLEKSETKMTEDFRLFRQEVFDRLDKISDKIDLIDHIRGGGKNN